MYQSLLSHVQLASQSYLSASIQVQIHFIQFANAVCVYKFQLSNQPFLFSIGFATLCGCPIIIFFFFVVLMHLYHLVLFRSLFATHHPQVAFLVIITIVSRLCHLAAVVLSLAGLAHLTVLVVFKVSKARFMFEESTYWFVKTCGIC